MMPTTAVAEIFGVTVRPSAETADQIYDQIQAWIDDPAHRPVQLLDAFDISFIATTEPTKISHRKSRRDSSSLIVIPELKR